MLAEKTIIELFRFEQALENNTSDALLLSAAISYMNTDQKEKARDLLYA